MPGSGESVVYGTGEEVRHLQLFPWSGDIVAAVTGSVVITSGWVMTGVVTGVYAWTKVTVAVRVIFPAYAGLFRLL